MARRRRVAIGGAVSAGVVVVAGLVLWAWLPWLVSQRVSDVGARRGVDVQVESVDLGWSSVRLMGLEAETSSLRVHVDEVDTGADLLALVLDGSSAVRRPVLSGVRVQVRVDDEALPRALRALRGPVGAAQARGTQRSRTIEIEDLSVVARDARGVLLRVEGGEGGYEPSTGARLELHDVEWAPEDPDRASVETLSVRAVQAESGWRLSSLHVEGVQLHYLEREGDEQSPAWRRLDESTAGLRSEFGSADPGPSANTAADRGPSAETSSTDSNSGAPVPAAGSADRPTPEIAARGEEEGPASEASSSSLLDRVAELRERLGPRLSDDARIVVRGVSITAHAAREDEGRPILRELDAEVRAVEAGQYRVEGSGRPGRGGQLGWDLLLDAEELRAEGEVSLERAPFALFTPFLPRLPWHRPEETRVSGELTVRGQGVSGVHLAGELSVQDLALSSSRIAPRPVQRIAFTARGEADWDPTARRLEVSRARLGLGDAHADISGSLEWPEDHYALDVSARLPSTECNAAIGAIPADLLGELNAFTWTGTLAGSVTARVDSRDLDATRLDIQVANRCRFVTAPAMADIRRFEAAFTHRVEEPDGAYFEMETGPGSVEWTPITSISPFLVQAVLGHEDGGFFRHSGFSPAAIQTALIRNLRAGRYRYGASTITMQLVKNVFLHREKTLARKVQEVLLTWWLESAMDKARILELYLNVIEYGPGVYGIRAGAQHYFGVSPADLGPAQAAYLATILPNPKAFHSHYEDDALPSSHRRRLARFLSILRSRGRFDAAATEYALARLDTFEFYQPGDPLPGILHVGRARALPFGDGALDQAWDEALGPDGAGLEEPFVDGAEADPGDGV